ncbi:hypothetical protein ACRE_040830 [Hapsidospora chrysogenum ATCC 11550]|uniref:Uncharacterized protein n=1 Tax=Hapsidospora chrysogenum (strain ATCC 11550 / CBS 779.69 / DSM 880 / IAM 14645 / JCM 23072 / IMI 49137) TaxID=857340 RepID=A0A086T700_HAPC1|nr:hypothetical protein ACRE_040830 [Hapsidospora chrysogenum ATCC 11550]
MQFSKLSAVAPLVPASVSGRAIRANLDNTPHGFTKVNPRPITEAVVSDVSLLKGTYRGHHTVIDPRTTEYNNMTTLSDIHSGVSVDLRLVNPADHDAHVYIAGNDPTGAVVFLRQDGNS